MFFLQPPFAFLYKEQFPVDGWKVYDPTSEYKRQVRARKLCLQELALVVNQGFLPIQEGETILRTAFRWTKLLQYVSKTHKHLFDEVGLRDRSNGAAFCLV